jgi:hypothetical protein
MRVPWKLIGLAGLAGVAATGAIVARKRRAHRSYDPDELRDRLHQRLAEASRTPSTASSVSDSAADLSDR